MGRKRRESNPGELLHIIQRGHNKNYIYEDTRDKKQFLNLSEELLDIYDFSLLYYALMDNHYHVLLEMGNDSISTIMQKLNLNYSRYYNKRYNRIGTIYGGRFSSRSVTNNAHLFRLLRYIAHNPVRAGIVKYPGEYRWSAHPAIRNNLNSVVAQEKVLHYFGQDREVARNRYITLIEDPDAPVITGEKQLEKNQQKITEYLNCLMDSMELPENIRSLIISGRFSTSAAKHIRNEFIVRAVEEGHKRKDIAEFLSTSYETVRRIASSEKVTERKNSIG
ncbi:MAG: transposase [Spirochaetales bacterium]|nr:transposase [Spirochaetales bacterium]